MTSTLRALGGTAALCATWFLSSVLPTPLLWYLPLARRFEFATVVTELGMDFYGRLLLGLVAAAVGALVAPALGAARVRLLFAWAVSLFVLCIALEATVLSRRNPVPLLPPTSGAP